MSLRRLALLETLSVCETTKSQKFQSVTWTRSLSAANPRPYTVFAL